MDEQDVVPEEERGTQPGLQLIVGGMSLDPVRDEQETDELAIVERFLAQVEFQVSGLPGDRAIIDQAPYYIQILVTIWRPAGRRCWLLITSICISANRPMPRRSSSRRPRLGATNSWGQFCSRTAKSWASVWGQYYA